MKVLKILLYILLAFILIGIFLGLMGPKSYDVRRSKVIAATPAQLWPYVSNWEKVNMWNPWVRMDKTIALNYTGDPGTVGSSYSWESKKMGKGSETITVLEPNQHADSELKIKMLGESTSQTGFILKDTTGGTEVTWWMSGKNNFMSRIMSSLMSMDKMIGKTYEDGLNNLQELMNTVPKETAPAYNVTTGQYPGGTYLAIREKTKISALKDFFSTNMSKLMDGVKAAKAEVAGPSSGLYFVWEPDNDMTDVATAIPIKAEVKAPAGMSIITVPASKSLTVEYMGGYAGMDKPHLAIDAYMKANNLQQTAPVIEEYYSGPMTEPDSAKWHTRIIYFVK